MERITNSLVLGLTGLDPETFRKYRKLKTDPKLHELQSSRKGHIEYDTEELINWMSVHFPIKGMLLKNHLKSRGIS